LNSRIKNWQMEIIDRKTAKEIVRNALTEVADFSSDFEGFTFNMFHPFHTIVFLNYLKRLVNRTECSDPQGNTTHEEFFDIDLNVNIFHTWNNLTDCIEHLKENHFRLKSPTGKIHLS